VASESLRLTAGLGFPLDRCIDQSHQQFASGGKDRAGRRIVHQDVVVSFAGIEPVGHQKTQPYQIAGWRRAARFIRRTVPVNGKLRNPHQFVCLGNDFAWRTLEYRWFSRLIDVTHPPVRERCQGVEAAVLRGTR